MAATRGRERISTSALDFRGVRVLPRFLDAAAQDAVIADLRRVAAAAPPVQFETARGQRMSVRMTSAGAVGWTSDRRGYRYAARHPAGTDWPPIPERLLALWRAVVPGALPPDTCLLNVYGEGARMGLHQDRDEADLSQPVVSLSLGDDALFRVGNVAPGPPTRSLWLRSGDVAVLEGPGRLLHHGVDRIRFRSSALLPGGGRMNVTLRVAR